MRPYLAAASKWHSEADAGPGAEAGAGFLIERMFFCTTQKRKQPCGDTSGSKGSETRGSDVSPMGSGRAMMI